MQDTFFGITEPLDLSLFETYWPLILPMFCEECGFYL